MVRHHHSHVLVDQTFDFEDSYQIRYQHRSCHPRHHRLLDYLLAGFASSFLAGTALASALLVGLTSAFLSAL